MSKISELSNGGALLSTDDLIVVRSGGNVRAQLSSLNGIAIGSSTPAAGSFTTGSFSGNVTASTSVNIGSGSGTSASAGFDEFVIEGGNADIGMAFLSPAANNKTQTIAFGDSNNNASGKITYNHSTDAMGFRVAGGSNALTVTSTGIDVTGSVTADGLTVGSSSVVADVTTGGSTPFFKVKRGTTNQANLVASFYNDNDAGIDVHGNGDISFYDGSGNAGLFWDSSAAALGIGTSSVVSPLTTSIGAGSAGSLNNQISMTHSGASTAFHLKTIRASANDEPDGLAFIQNTSEAMRISGGKVNIGGSTMSELLNVQTASSSATAMIEFRNTQSGTQIGMPANENALIFKTADAEAMRIDSSQNLLVGTTDTVPSNNGAGGDAGVAISPDGVFRAARSGNVSLDINRMDSDGDIAAFRKDGSTVGAISAISDDLAIHSTASGHEGLRFGNGAIVPTDNAGASTDNACNLGGATGRFSDLYLAGTAHVGTQVKFPSVSYDDRAIGLDSTGFYLYNNDDSRYDLVVDQSGNFIVGNTSAGAASAVTLRADGVIIAPEVYSTAVSASLRDLQIDSSGFFGYSTSTRATKDNIEPLTDVSWLLDLEPVSFNRKITETEVSTETEYGLVADDVESVNANICFYDETENGKELVGITYSKLITPILKLVQEQQTLIETLTDRIAALEQ